MRLIRRQEWGAGPPKGAFVKCSFGGRGTVHYSASAITPTGRGQKFGGSPPEKPGAKWYRLWRNHATPIIQRRKISRMISHYNAAMTAFGSRGATSKAMQEREAAIMRGFQAFHQGPSRGWTDIAYHRVIFASGNVYEGRPGRVMGAHAYGANDTMGCCFVMTDGDQPTPYMLQTFAEIAKTDRINVWRGHRQRPGNSTSCPGDALMKALKL